MDTSTDTMISLKTRILDSPSVRVLVAWGCGLLWGCGLFLFIWFFLGVALSGFLRGSSPAISGTLWLRLGLGLVMLFSGTALLGIFFARRRYGIVAGLLAMPGGVIGFVIYYIVVLVPLALVPITEIHTLGLSNARITGGFAAAVVVAVILLSAEEFPHRRLGLALGVVVGLGLSLVSGFVLGQGILPYNNEFNFFWQVPPLIWATVVYFVELARGQGGRRAFLIWLLLVVITFCLPFLIVPLFPKTT